MDANERRTSYAHDVFGKLTKIIYFDHTFELFAYDPEHRNTKATNCLGQTFAMHYDSVGNLISKVYPSGLTEDYAYDAKYRLTAVTNVLWGTTLYTYDVKDRNTAVTDALGNKTEYSYNLRLVVREILRPQRSLQVLTKCNNKLKKIKLQEGEKE